MTEPTRERSPQSSDDDPRRVTERSWRGPSSWLPPRTMVGFIAAILAVLAIWVLSQQNQQSRTEGAERMTRTLEISQHLETLLSTL